jgi:hypothetical protein
MSVEARYGIRVIQPTDEFSPHFFIRKDFLDYQSTIFGMQVIRLGVFSEADQSLLAYCAFAGKDGHWQTPITGAFGGVANKKNVPIDALEFLVERIPHLMSSQCAVQSLTFKLPPASFPDNSLLIANILYRNNWSLTGFDLNYHLIVRPAEEYLGSLGETKRKFIRRLHASGAEFQEAGHTMLDTVYRVIERNRSAQGYPMTMSLDAMSALVQRFKCDIRLFTVTLESRVVASAICIQIAPKYLYVFYWGELPEFRMESPVLLLAKGIVEFCFSNGFEVMDVGTSSVNSVPNLGLCAFKESLGCRVTQKPIYKWKVKCE